ncbi:MAG: FAD:protein FMN transferase [Deltaproteobacteria bacterium]|nr:FAD:protein FMN transferase [Deltaproteobacteria bacterium]
MDLKKKITYALIVLSVLSILAASLFKGRQKDSVTISRAMMGTIVQVTIMEGPEDNSDRAAETAFSEIQRLEGILSAYKTDSSDVTRISKNAGASLPVSPDTIEVLKTAVLVAELSGGAFDPTVGVLGKAWGYSGEKGVVPSREEIGKSLPLVDYGEIEIDEAASKAGLKRKGMSLNLGGVAKGYIVNKAVEALKREGVERGIIHAGGDMVVFQKDEEVPFSIGIQHPREKRLLGKVRVYNGAVATSGDYERFFEINGKKYHHILDPRTGFPAEGTQSATIIAKDPTLADALSTAVFVMGPEKGMELIERLPDVEGVIVDSSGRVTKSSGFKGEID